MWEWVSVPLCDHVVFPASSRRKGDLSHASDHFWMRKSFFLQPVSLFLRHARILLLVRGFWELLYFSIYFSLFLLFLTPTYLLQNPQIARIGATQSDTVELHTYDSYYSVDWRFLYSLHGFTVGIFLNLIYLHVLGSFCGLVYKIPQNLA